MPQFSALIQALRASSTIAFNAKALELKRAGVDVIAMTAGEPDFQPPAHVLAAAHEAIDRGMTKYTASEGTLELRQAIVNKHARENGLAFTPDQVVVSTGGKQSLYNAFMSILDPGDEVIVPAPYWVSYPAQIQLAGGVTVPVACRAEDGFVPDPEAIAAAITPRTRAIVVNSPSNPTGAVVPEGVLKAIADLAEQHDLWLVSDELYEHLVYEGTFTPVAQWYPERTVLVHGASKGYALTGWRIGWACAPVALAKAMNRLQGQVTSNANAVAQYATQVALESVEATAAFQAMTRAAYRERRDLLVAGLNDLGLPTPMPHGAFYAMADLRTIDPDETVAATVLLEQARVAVVPGTDFLAPGFARLSYACSTGQVAEAVQRIAAVVGR
ncbi:MAG: pyridoxal phosphate-dependent aminotransferase [Trueperaceae bacterium]|nr:pyridoxal phosphate-dependent aminotransferase [Trueperaceae bacterium]